MHEASFFAEPLHWVVISFFLFFIIFGKKVWGALAGMLDARAASVRAEMDEAARLKSEAEAKRREQMALDRIAAAQKQAVDEIRTAAAEVATIAARQVIAEGLSAESSAALIDQAIARLPAALAARRAA